MATEGVIAAIVLIFVRKLWGYCYSTEEEVVSYVAQMLVLLAGSHFLDGIQSVLSGSSKFLQYEFPASIFQDSRLQFLICLKQGLRRLDGYVARTLQKCCWIPQKCTTYEGSEMHLATLLKSPSKFGIAKCSSLIS